MDISKIDKQDIESLSVLYQQLIPNEISLTKMESVYERNKDNPNHIVLVAKENGEVIGTILAVICEMFFGQCKSFMVVEDFVVDEMHRNKGIGTALMDQIESFARNRNCSYIMLITDSDRISSQNFYKSLGYKSDEYRAFKKKI